jgi:hypothetical protein
MAKRVYGNFAVNPFFMVRIEWADAPALAARGGASIGSYRNLWYLRGLYFPPNQG